MRPNGTPAASTTAARSLACSGPARSGSRRGSRRWRGAVGGGRGDARGALCGWRQHRAVPRRLLPERCVARRLGARARPRSRGARAGRDGSGPAAGHAALVQPSERGRCGFPLRTRRPHAREGRALRLLERRGALRPPEGRPAGPPVEAVLLHRVPGDDRARGADAGRRGLPCGPAVLRGDEGRAPDGLRHLRGGAAACPRRGRGLAPAGHRRADAKPRAAVSAFLFLLLSSAFASPPDEPAVVAVRLSGELRIDGRLDEPAWALAAPATGLRQREPLEGQPATEQTEVRVLFDARNLYIGILARDSEPERVVAHLLQRDKLLEPGGYDGSHEFAGDDAVAILLDPFRDRRNAFVFATNANGAEFDALLTDEAGAFNADWRTVWTVRARRGPEGWSAEMAIPFRSLRYPFRTGEDGWGFNVWRMIRRKNEETLWTAWSRTGGGFHRVSQAGRLDGLTDLPRTRANIEVKPYGLVGLTQAPRGGDTLGTSGDADAGLDA